MGVLALQGAFAEHASALEALGARAVEVRGPSELVSVDALVLPGGESTTMSMLLTTSGLFDAVAERLREGTPVFGTCAGLILLATDIVDGRPDQRSFGVLDVSVLRNGYGRQRDSFETDVVVGGATAGVGAGPDGATDTFSAAPCPAVAFPAAPCPAAPFPAVFIRAPRITRTGAGVEVLASVGDDPVLVRQGPVLAAAFHPELSGDLRLHRLFLGGI